MPNMYMNPNIACLVVKSHSKVSQKIYYYQGDLKKKKEMAPQKKLEVQVGRLELVGVTCTFEKKKKL